MTDRVAGSPANLPALRVAWRASYEPLGPPPDQDPAIQLAKEARDKGGVPWEVKG